MRDLGVHRGVVLEGAAEENKWGGAENGAIGAYL